MFKVITMSDKNYFGAGDLFLKTRNKVDADFVLYGPDITKDQIKILHKHNIGYVKVNPEKFKNEMQYLKFEFMFEEINYDIGIDNKYQGYTFVDFDTFFINDWKHVFNYNFDFGVTIRNSEVKKRLLRAYTNGGVMFAKNSSYKFFEYIRKVIFNGGDKLLKEYDEIWKTLEIGRPAHKTHYRTTRRWWVDQIMISSLALRFFRNNGYKKIGLKPQIFNFNNFNIGLFGCDYYNVVESKPVITKEKNVYIRHLKNTGRSSLGLKKVKEKI